jgi:hypothetical protein
MVGPLYGMAHGTEMCLIPDFCSKVLTESLYVVHETNTEHASIGPDMFSSKESGLEISMES